MNVVNALAWLSTIAIPLAYMRSAVNPERALTLHWVNVIAAPPLIIVNVTAGAWQPALVNIFFMVAGAIGVVTHYRRNSWTAV